MNPIPAPEVSLLPVLPLVVVVGGAMACLVLDLVPRLKGTWILAALAGLTLVGLGAVSLLVEPGGEAYSGMVQDDLFARFFNVIFAIAGLLTLLISGRYLKAEGRHRIEYHCLLLFAVGGMVVMAMSRHLLLLYVGIELMAMPVYILVAFLKRMERATEAAMKYFILGATASAFLLFGLSLVYGLTGTLELPEVAAAVAQRGLAGNPALLFALALVLAAFAFKVAAAPFHLWTPDVYVGAPTPITAFMSVAPKAAGFAALLRVLVIGFPGSYEVWAQALTVLAILTMSVGNLVAVVQKSVKRMLAYSSIAHAGYLLVGLAVATASIPESGLPDGLTAILFYFLAYAFANIGAFAVLSVLGREGTGEGYEDFRGLGYRRPALGLAMAIFMFSLAGIPPTAGFVGKLYLFGAAVSAGAYTLAVVGVLNSAISLFYYMGVVMAMYMSNEEAEVSVASSHAVAAALVIMVAFSLILGVAPAGPLSLARDAVAGLF